jgi:hypothetical protein
MFSSHIVYRYDSEDLLSSFLLSSFSSELRVCGDTRTIMAHDCHGPHSVMDNLLNARTTGQRVQS